MSDEAYDVVYTGVDEVPYKQEEIQSLLYVVPLRSCLELNDLIFPLNDFVSIL
jgi:hypothetical protein